jgi:hypothetical protein
VKSELPDLADEAGTNAADGKLEAELAGATKEALVKSEPSALANDVGCCCSCTHAKKQKGIHFRG